MTSFHSAPSQVLRLVHDILHDTTDFPTPPVRDDAERAELIATVDDGDVSRHIGRRRQRAYAAFGVDSEPVAQQIDKRLVLLRLHEHVHVREPVGKGVLARPNHAAHQAEYLIGVALHDGLEVGQHTDHAVFGALPDDAAIQDYDVRLAGGLTGGEAHLTQRAFEALGVGLVHLTAYCPDVVTLHSGPFFQFCAAALCANAPTEAVTAWQALIYRCMRTVQIGKNYIREYTYHQGNRL